MSDFDDSAWNNADISRGTNVAPKQYPWGVRSQIAVLTPGVRRQVLQRMWKPSVSTSRMSNGLPLVTSTMSPLPGRRDFVRELTLRRTVASVCHVFLLVVSMSKMPARMLSEVLVFARIL